MDLVVLFYGGNPTVYEVQEEKGTYIFTPMSSLHNDSQHVPFVLRKVNGGWQADGTDNMVILEQAVEKAEAYNI